MLEERKVNRNPHGNLEESYPIFHEGNAERPAEVPIRRRMRRGEQFGRRSSESCVRAQLPGFEVRTETVCGLNAR